MKNIYAILTLSLLILSASIYGQERIYSPKLQSPVNLATDQVPNVILDWEAVTGISPIIYYELYLDEDPDFNSPVIFDNLDLTACTMSELIFGQSYYWKVRAYDDNEEYSDWSETRSFTITWTVKLRNPADGNMVFANPEITWDELTGITGYQFQLDTVNYWISENSTITDDLLSSQIVDEVMWAVGQSGTIIYNDGNGWETSESGVSNDLNDVCFISASEAYTVGSDGTVLYYDGSIWSSIEISGLETNDIYGVSFVDSDNGIIVGSDGLVVIYNNGEWINDTIPDLGKTDLYDVQMVDAQNIWICGKSGYVAYYNAGEWELNQIMSRDLNAICMLSNEEGWAAGAGGNIFHFGGEFWNQEESGITTAINDIIVTETEKYAVINGGSILVHNGYFWIQQASGSTNDLLSIDLSGEKGIITGAQGTIVYKGDTGFDSPFLTTINVPGDSTSLGLSNLLFGEKFYYRMRAYHGADTSAWSEIKSIETYSTVTLTTPNDGATVDLVVDLIWSEYSGATNYIVQIDVDESFSSPNNYSIDYYETIFTTGIFGADFYWRVAAQHVEDISPWSEVRHFVTKNTIELDSPENSLTDVDICPVLSWSLITGAGGYTIWVDTDPTFPAPSVSTSDTSFLQCSSSLEYETTYYWKVRAYTGGSQSDWSETWSFTTQETIGIEEVFNSDAVVIYPNPSNGNFSIIINSLKSDEYTIKVIDISGRLIKELDVNCTLGNNAISLDITNVETGVYNVVISNGNQIVTKRMMVN